VRADSVALVRIPRSARLARLTAVLASAAAVAYLLFFLFGPVYTRCGLPLVAPGQASGPGECRTMGWFEQEFGQQHVGPFDARPIVFLTLWTLAPFVALIGTRLPAARRGLGIALVLFAFVVDASSIISMGGGFVYALLCGPLLLITFIALTVALVLDQRPVSPA
jgi:hypothetical protein